MLVVGADPDHLLFHAHRPAWFPGVPPDIVVAALGALVVLVLAFLLTRVAPRGPLFITAATLIFAITVRPLGLVIASFVSLVVSAYATEEVRWIETIIWCRGAHRVLLAAVPLGAQSAAAALAAVLRGATSWISFTNLALGFGVVFRSSISRSFLASRSRSR